MEFTAEQIADIARNIKAHVVENAPNASHTAFTVTFRRRRGSYYSVDISFEETGASLYWAEIDPRDIIDAGYDMLYFWDDVHISIGGNDRIWVEIIKVMAGDGKYQAELAESREENAKLREKVARLKAKNTELRLRPGGPDYENVKSRFENLARAGEKE